MLVMVVVEDVVDMELQDKGVVIDSCGAKVRGEDELSGKVPDCSSLSKAVMGRGTR